MDRFKNFMEGRYGSDQLNTYLLALAILLTLIGRFGVDHIWGNILTLIGYIPLITVIYRMFSKNIQKRSMENYRFAMLISPVYLRFKNLQNKIQTRWRKSHPKKSRSAQAQWEERKKYRYFTCPSCKNKMKVPRGKGKIRITCKYCGHKFEKRT
jgi:ribosomal protein S27E